MEYKINIFSRDECVIFSKRKIEQDCVIISINDTGFSTDIKNNERIKDILYLNFDDLDFNIEGYTLFNSYMANQIKILIDKYKHTLSHYIVHCTAGISRSAAVGFILTKYLNGDDSDLFKKGCYVPNKLVYKIMSETFGFDYNEEEFMNKLDLKYLNSICPKKEYKFDEDFLDVILK